MNEYAFNRTFNAMQEAYDNMQPPDDYYDGDEEQEEFEDDIIEPDDNWYDVERAIFEDEGRTLDWIYGK